MMCVACMSELHGDLLSLYGHEVCREWNSHELCGRPVSNREAQDTNQYKQT